MNFFKNLKDLGIIAVTITIILILILLWPAVVLYAINTLAELGGSTFYIPHNITSYFCMYLLYAVFVGIRDAAKQATNTKK